MMSGRAVSSAHAEALSDFDHPCYPVGSINSLTGLFAFTLHLHRF